MADAVQKGCRKVTILTVDTDVVVQAVASFSKIAHDELWVALGVKIHSYLQNGRHNDTNTVSDTPSLPCFYWV